GRPRLDTLIKGDTVREVLDYVEFDAEMLLGKLRTDVETAVRDGRIGYEGAGELRRFYEAERRPRRPQWLRRGVTAAPLLRGRAPRVHLSGRLVVRGWWLVAGG